MSDPGGQPVIVRVQPLRLPVGDMTDGSEVRVWDADLDRPPLPPAELVAVLSPAERERHARLRYPLVATRFAHARGLLRHLLGRTLGVRPENVPLVVTADGKPEVPGGPFFNLSHTAGRLLVAVAPCPVGVDIERVRTVPASDDLVRRWFHPAERDLYERLPADRRPAAFLRGWTCKEALLKGVGCGSRELAGCRVELDPDCPPGVALSPDGQAWQVVCWQPDEGYTAAVAVRSPRRIELLRVGVE